MAYISQITLPSGTTYNLKDEGARDLIAELLNYTTYLGVTTTALTDGSTTNPITINGESVTATNGCVATYNSDEFIFNGTIWQKFGTLAGLGSLAYKSSASGNFTPSGSVSTPTISIDSAGATGTVTEVTDVGSMPTYTVSNEVLTISAGVVPTTNNVTVKTGDASYISSQPSFTGTQGTVTVS